MCDFCKNKVDTICYQVYHSAFPTRTYKLVRGCSEHESAAYDKVKAFTESEKSVWHESLFNVKEFWRKNSNGEFIHQDGLREQDQNTRKVSSEHTFLPGCRCSYCNASHK